MLPYIVEWGLDKRLTLSPLRIKSSCVTDADGRLSNYVSVKVITGLQWTGLDWTGLDWTGLDWTGLD